MHIYTKWVCYSGEIGITDKGEFFELSTGKQLLRCEHQGSVYYRSYGSKKRYSYKKCNETKELKRVEIILCPF